MTTSSTTDTSALGAVLSHDMEPPITTQSQEAPPVVRRDSNVEKPLSLDNVEATVERARDEFQYLKGLRLHLVTAAFGTILIDCAASPKTFH